ncbi:MAG: type 1 glutamine amidotransferase [Pseudomonadota bacterium]
MKIGILHCGHTAPSVIANHGEYAEMFQRLLAGPGRRFVTWDVVDGDFPDGPDAAEAWVMTGSPLGVYEGHPFIASLEALTREIVAARRPLAGICFGHQLLAQALGGKVAKHPGGWRMGPQPYRIEGVQDPVRLHAWHQDQVTIAPPGAQVIASGPDCAVAGMAIGAHVLTFQAHPEFTDAVVVDLIAARRGASNFANAPFAEAEAELGTPIDRDWAAHRIGAFLEQAEAQNDG